MKKCSKCGAVQKDERSICIDCGAVLKDPMSEEDAEALDESLDYQLDEMVESCEEFFVPVRDKIAGIMCVVIAAAAVVLLFLISRESARIKPYVGDEVISQNFASFRMREISDAGYVAISAVIASLVSAPMLLLPRFTWFINTARYRILYGWDCSPTFFHIAFRKIVAYALLLIGALSAVIGYWIYF